MAKSVKKKIPVLTKEQLSKEYTVEEYAALKPSARNQIIGYLWATNQVVPYTKNNQHGVSIEFGKQEDLQSIKGAHPLANDVDVVAQAVVNTDPEDDDFVTNAATVLSILGYAKKQGFKTYSAPSNDND